MAPQQKSERPNWNLFNISWPLWGPDMSSAGIKKEYRTRGKVCIALDRMIEGCFCFVVFDIDCWNWLKLRRDRKFFFCAFNKNFQLSNFDSFSSRQKFRTKRSLLTEKTFCVVRVSSTEFLLVYFQVVRIPRKGSSAILQSMSISSSPLLFIVCNFLAIVSALTAATFLRTIQLLGGFTAQNNNCKRENIKDRKDLKSVWNNWFIKGWISRQLGCGEKFISCSGYFRPSQCSNHGPLVQD